MAMDSTRRNADGMKPIKAELERIAAIRDRGELSKTIAESVVTVLIPFSDFTWVPTI